MKIYFRSLIVIIGIWLIATPSFSQSINESQTTLSFGGYAKMDMIYSRFYNGEVSDVSPMRDFYFPALIPVGSDITYEYLDFHVKESRFNFDVRSNLNGHKLRAFVEMDFMLSGVGNEKISNSFNPRLRHFFLEYDNFLAGQTWSTFMTVILPDGLDFIRAPEGMVFIRQPMLRLTLNSWQFAIENPTTTVSTYQSTRSRLRNSGGTPDFVVRKNLKGDWGTFSGSAIFRELSLIDSAGVRKREPAYGVSLGGKLFVGKSDDIRFMATAGSGLGRYVGLNFVTSSVLCEQKDLHSIRTINGYFAYKHQWSPKWRSTVNVSAFLADHEDRWTGLEVNKSVWSSSANLIFTPVKDILFGAEYTYAERERYDGTTGSFSRIQFSAKYSFKVNR